MEAELERVLDRIIKIEDAGRKGKLPRARLVILKGLSQRYKALYNRLPK